jgi:hypothetical protein
MRTKRPSLITARYILLARSFVVICRLRQRAEVGHLGEDLGQHEFQPSEETPKVVAGGGEDRVNGVSLAVPPIRCSDLRWPITGLTAERWRSSRLIFAPPAASDLK